ncbi:MAG: peptidylprolyl isomerase [Polyangiales bacterium]
MERAKISIVLVGALTFNACGREETATRVAPLDARVVANVVARVGERPIGAADVAARMTDQGLDARTALDRLIEEELLAQEATRVGIREDRDEERAVERVMVRAMLRDFEAELTPELVAREEVRADFEANRDKLQVPERRISWHILVKDSSQDGKRKAESIRNEVRAADDPKAVFRRYAEDGEAKPELAVTAEELPPITPRASIEQPYKDALFAAQSTGLLDAVVETSYGWHVIVLTEILPGERKTLRDVEEEIRVRLSKKKRFERMVEVVRKGEADGLVTYDEEGVARLMAMPGLPTRAE